VQSAAYRALADLVRPQIDRALAPLHAQLAEARREQERLAAEVIARRQLLNEISRLRVENDHLRARLAAKIS